jgi:ubiquinone biosynthesis protein UbiJ
MAGKLKHSMISTSTAAILSSAFNRYLALDPEAPDKLKAFDGKVICIEISGVDTELYLSIENNAVEIIQDIDVKPDTVISGSPASLFKLGLHRDSASLFFSGEVEIRGDTRLGRQFKALIAEMEIDWEEHLSTLTGDIAAHRLMTVFDRLAEWSKGATSNLTDDIGEYLQEESRDVVSGAEIDMFNQQVDRLRDDTDRLEARITRLADVIGK